MDYEILKREYEFCGKYPIDFKTDYMNAMSEIEFQMNSLSFFQVRRKKELQQMLINIKGMSDYENQFNNKVRELKEKYLAEGYLEKSVKWLLSDIENKIVSRNIQQLSIPGILSMFLTCEEDYVIIESAKNSKDQKGSGALGELSFGGAILYEGSVQYGVACSEMAYMYGIAELINGKDMPISGMKYFASVVSYDNDNDRRVSRVWVNSYEDR